MLITIERSGSFPVGWHHSHNHQCGNVGTGTLTYAVQLQCHDTDLNALGYILDNNSIPTYFRDKYATVENFLSCEHIACEAVKGLRAVCHKEGSDPCYIRVGVSGIPGSMISAEEHYRTSVIPEGTTTIEQADAYLQANGINPKEH